MIITGEIIQQKADIYLGYDDDFNFNPIIKNQTHKHINFNNIYSKYNNPSTIFCYSHRINELYDKMHLFSNPFILITHNSDENIIASEKIITILNNPIILNWYAQNVCFYHPKLHMMPIGIANSMWVHGDLTLYNNQYFMDSCKNKTQNVYFFFNIGTNKTKREPCYIALKYKLEWLQDIEPNQNIIRLSQYRFCICPEGNGVDTHRLWEALYLKCIPIVIKTPFTETLLRHNIPLVVLDTWEEFDESKLKYNYPDSFSPNIFYNW